MQSQNLELHIISIKEFAKYPFCSPKLHAMYVMHATFLNSNIKLNKIKMVKQKNIKSKKIKNNSQTSQEQSHDCSPRDVSDGIRNLAKTSSRSQNIILDLCGELEVGAT